MVVLEGTLRMKPLPVRAVVGGNTAVSEVFVCAVTPVPVVTVKYPLPMEVITSPAGSPVPVTTMPTASPERFGAVTRVLPAVVEAPATKIGKLGN